MKRKSGNPTHVEWLILVWVLTGYCSGICGAEELIRPLPVVSQTLLPVKTVKEPSGICYHTQRKTLFVADDEGSVCEITTNGKVLQVKGVAPGDLEGITHNPETGRLYVAVEGDESILEVDPETLSLRRKFKLSREYEGNTVMAKGGQGIEGITFIPDKDHPQGGIFWVANQCFSLDRVNDLSALFEVEVPLKEGSSDKVCRIVGSIQPRVTDLSGLHFDSERNQLFVISDSNNVLMIYQRSGELASKWILPGEDQEGITIDPEGYLYLAQDSGGILKIQVDWRI